MTLEGVDVVGQVVAAGLARLGRHVADEHDERPRGGDRLADARHQEGRQDARVEAARADHDDLGLRDRPHGVLAGAHVLRGDPDPVQVAAPGDAALALDLRAVARAARAG